LDVKNPMSTLPSQIPSITSRLSAFGNEKQSTQMTTKPLGSHIVFDLANNTNDDNVFVISTPFTSTSA